MAGGVDMSAGVGGHLHLGVISQRSILHAVGEPQVLAEALVGKEHRHILPVPVGDVQNPPPAVLLPSNHLQPRNAAAGAAVITAVWRWVGGGGGGGGGEEGEEE